jgi:hypothetical protein
MLSDRSDICRGCWKTRLRFRPLALSIAAIDPPLFMLFPAQFELAWYWCSDSSRTRCYETALTAQRLVPCLAFLLRLTTSHSYHSRFVEGYRHSASPITIQTLHPVACDRSRRASWFRFGRHMRRQQCWQLGLRQQMAKFAFFDFRERKEWTANFPI